jgi:hypothetical protein
MNTNESELLLLKNEVFEIVGCAIEILNTFTTDHLRNPTKCAGRKSLTLRKFRFGSNRHSSRRNPEF